MTGRKIKIAVLVNSFWNGNSGGISGGDHRMIQVFKRMGSNISIDIYTSPEGKKVIEREMDSANIIVSPSEYETGNLILTYIRRTRWLNQELCQKKYDLIYSTSDFLPDVLPALRYLGKERRTKWLSLIHHIYPSWRQRPGGIFRNIIAELSQRYSLSLIKNRADRIINVSMEVRDGLVERGFSPNKIGVNPNGVDLEFIDSVIGTERQPHQAIFIARLNFSKGIFDLTKIWKQVVAKLPDAILKVVGGGETAVVSKLQAEINAAGLADNIELCGFMSMAKPETIKLAKQSSVFVFPSHEEGFGIAIAEAMACRLPAVAWDLSVYDEVFPSGLVKVKMNDFDKFAEAVVETMESDERRSMLSSQGYNLVKNYSWSSIAQNEEKIIRKVVEEK